jgi:tRNA uridine 5-carbamoylmethylation protein Kti12
MAGQVIVVTGPPGAGKTTAARLIADALSPSVHLHADDFWDYIRSGRIPPHLPESKQQNELVMQIVAETAIRYAGGGYRVVVDGIVGPWFIGVFRTLAAESDSSLHYFVVRPDASIARDRAMSRPFPVLTDDEPVRKMHAEFSGLGSFEAYVLDNSRQTAEETARLVIERVAAGSHQLASVPEEL